MDDVILVSKDDAAIGTMDKLTAHETGELHRAFSVFIFNSKGELLLQQRSYDKYHSGGLWTNTCCSHPKPGEETLAAAHRRIKEEMGMECELINVFSFTYLAKLENGLTEHEFDHVFFGFSDDLPIINKEEVKAFSYLSMADLRKELLLKPEAYTEWLKICFGRVVEKFNAYQPNVGLDH